MPETPRDPGAVRAAASAFVVSSLAARAQSVAEIRRKLASRDVPPQVADVVIDDALALGYLDDAELAHQLARGYRARGYGRRRAAATLRRRGLGPDTAAPALRAEFANEGEAALALAALGRRPVGDPRPTGEPWPSCCAGDSGPRPRGPLSACVRRPTRTAPRRIARVA